ncbi:MAG: cytochrome B6, partial [Vicinamibacteria bacterium]|nr:cytochrome B6 [Vicinamibacteria bacterium]
KEATGVWFARDRRLQNIVFILLCVFILGLTFVGTFMRGPYWNIYWPWEVWPAIPGRI